MNAPDKNAVLAHYSAEAKKAENKPTGPSVNGTVNIGELTIKRLINGVMTELFSNDPVRVDVIVEIDSPAQKGNFCGHPDTWEPAFDEESHVFSARAFESIQMFDADGEDAYVIEEGDELVNDLSHSQEDDILSESVKFEVDHGF